MIVLILQQIIICRFIPIWQSNVGKINFINVNDEVGNVIFLSCFLGKLLGRDTFDIPNDNTAQDRFANFIRTAPNNTVVLVNGGVTSRITSPDLIKVLKSVGARDPNHISSAQVYFLVGYKGLDKMHWVEEVMLPGYMSATFRKRIPFFGG